MTIMTVISIARWYQEYRHYRHNRHRKEIYMRKTEVYTRIFKELLNEELLNEADANDIVDLQKDVEQIVRNVLEDYTLVFSVGIIEE